MKKIILTILIILTNSWVSAEANKPTLETGVKISRTEFIPFDYSRIASDSNSTVTENIFPLKNNAKTINPFFLIYKNLDKGFGFEIEYFNIKIERASYSGLYYFSQGSAISKQYLRNNERSDLKINFFFYPSEKVKEYFSFGFGLRKIDRVRNRDEGNFSAEEKFVTLGPQFILKSTIPITNQLSINLGLDIFHTQGKRDYSFSDSSLYSSRSGLYSDFTFIKQNGKTLGIFQGYEANIQIKYNLFENFNLSIGYNYNYSYFKYENLEDAYYVFSSQSNRIYYADIKPSNGREILKGFYISGSTVF